MRDYSKTLYLLEDDIDNLNEALDTSTMTALTSLLPKDKSESIKQLFVQNKEKELISLINSYIADNIGGPVVKNIPGAIDVLKKDKTDSASITNILLKASMPKDEVDSMTSIQKKRTLNTLAEKNGINSRGKPVAEITSALNNVLAVKGAQTTKTQSTSATPAGREKVNIEPALEPFPGKRDLFIQSYKKTLNLGWPGEPIKVGKDKEGNDTITQEATGKLIPFNVGAKIGTKLTNAIPPAKILPSWVKLAKTLVYNKFKQDPNGLKRLIDTVDDIIEKNKTWKLSRRINVRDKFASIGSSLLSKFGASDKDLSVFNWLVKKSAGLDIFEFQKLILAEVQSAVDMSDDRITKMEKVAKGLKKMMEGDSKSPKFTISPLNSSQTWNGYQVWYNIKTNMKPNTSPANMTEPMRFYLEQIMRYLKTDTKKTWTEFPSETDIQAEIDKIRDYITNPKESYTYDAGEDGPLSLVEEEKNGDKLIGTQYMFPVYLGKDGVRIYVKYQPERSE